MRFILIAVVLAAFAACVWGQTSEITYQGQLQNSSVPANGSFDFAFALFDGGGAQIGPTLTRSGVAVAGGIFSVNLDFGAGFPGATRFLEIRVRQAGGGAFTTLSPRQPVTSAPYSIKSLTASTADNATNAANAANAVNASTANTAGTATNFTGNLAGDVTGTQISTTVARLQSRTVAPTAPLDGQVLKFNSANNRWQPDTDNVGSGAGGDITGVTAGTGLAGGGATGNVTLNIANGGVGTAQLADGGVTAAKIPAGQVVKGVNGLEDSVTLSAGSNISITPSGNTLTIASTGGGGDITGVTAGTGLTGGGTTGSVTLNIANGGVGTAQLADGSVTDAKIVTVSGAKVTGTVANATNATTATNATQLGGVAASQYLQTNGNGSGLTNLNASNITTGTLANARLGQIPTANIADSAVTSAKIAGGQVAKSVNGLTDNVTLAAGSNISITPSGNTLTIASTGSGGVSGSGTAGQIALWNGTSSLATSQISQSGGNIGVGLTSGAPTDRLTVQSPTDNYGIVNTDGAIAVGTYLGGTTGRGWFGTKSNHPLSFFTNDGGPRLTIGTNGRVDIGSIFPTFPSQLYVEGGSGNAIIGKADLAGGIGLFASGALSGVEGFSVSGVGVRGSSSSSSGTGILASNGTQGGVALRTQGTSFFKGDTSPLSATNVGNGTGIAIGSSGTLGYISSFDYGAFQPRTLLLNNSGGNVGIGHNNPLNLLDVFGDVRIGSGTTGCLADRDGTIIAGICSSDLRYKRNVKPFGSILHNFSKLRPVNFYWRREEFAEKHFGAKQSFGLIAQEVEKVFPDLVSTDDKGYKSINYSKLPLLTIQAVNEQQLQIETQQKQIEQQRRQQAAMLNSIKEQQAMIEKLSRQVRTLQRSRKRR